MCRLDSIFVCILFIVCDISFSQKGNLTTHIKRQHKTNVKVNCEEKATTELSKRLIVNIERMDYSEYLKKQNIIVENSRQFNFL